MYRDGKKIRRAAVGVDVHEKLFTSVHENFAELSNHK
jgi:hypothetical protein